MIIKTHTLLKKITQIFKKHFFLIAIILLAFSVRLYGVYPGFPDNHPDETLGYQTAIYMFYHNLEPNSFDYGMGRPLLLLFIFKVFILPFVFAKIFFTNPDIFFNLFSKGASSLPEYANVLFGERSIYALYWARYVSALIGGFSVLLLYFVANKLFNKQVALFAVFFLAFSYWHVLLSLLGLPEIHNSFFSLLALFGAILLLEKNTKSRYVFAAIAASLAFSIKYQTFSLFPFLFVHLVWAIRKKSFFYLLNKNFILSMIFFVVIFFIINPFLIFNLEQFSKETRYNYLRYQMGVLRLRAYPFFYLFHWGLGELSSIIILLGMIFMFIKQRTKFLLLMSFVVPFFFVMTYYSNGGIYTRNFATVVPFLMILAGYGIYTLYLFIKKISRVSANLLIFLIIIILLFVNFSSVRNSLLLSFSYARPLSSDMLTDWFSKNMPENVRLRNYNLLLSSSNSHVFTDAIKEKNIEQLPWDYSKGPNSLAEFQEDGTDFAILNTQPLQSVTYWWRGWPMNKLLKYDAVPIDYITNGFYGLSVKELQQYTVAEIYKPWQAAAANNYLVFKIPTKIKDVGKQIMNFDFNNKSAMWETRGSMDLQPGRFEWGSEEGKKQKGVLINYSGGGGNTSRLASAPIAVREGKVYTVAGWIKNHPKSDVIEKDGFIRMDFYKDKNEAMLEMGGILVALSSRAPVTGEWIKVSASGKSPKGANYMTVSFQREYQPTTITSYLDDVEVFESNENPKEPFRNIPYIKSNISNEDIYYNSFL